jgi:hypothetical protein
MYFRKTEVFYFCEDGLTRLRINRSDLPVRQCRSAQPAGSRLMSEQILARPNEQVMQRMSTKSRQRIYSSSIRAAAERARDARKQADRRACEAWKARILGHRDRLNRRRSPCAHLQHLGVRSCAEPRHMVAVEKAVREMSASLEIQTGLTTADQNKCWCGNQRRAANSVHRGGWKS